MERVLAQAMPTPAMESSRRYLLWITATDSSPAAPQSRQTVWVCFAAAAACATPGRTKEKTKHDQPSTSEKQSRPTRRPRV